MSSSQRLDFNPAGPKCCCLQTFYRLCGHVETSYMHTALCATSLQAGLQPSSLPFCWNPFPLGKHVAYCVGRCYACQMREEPGVQRENEPHRNVQRGTQASVGWTKTPLTAERIRCLARDWRAVVEEQEREQEVRTEMLRKERALKKRRQEREIQWERAWQRHVSETDSNYQAPVAYGEAQTGEIDAFFQRRRAKILDLTDDFSRLRTSDDLLIMASGVSPDDNCSICRNKFSEPSLFSDNDAPDVVVGFQGRCDHVFHRTCIITLLTKDKPQCPDCRALYRFVLKNGFDDPKFRWILENPRDTDIHRGTAKHRLWKIAGYIPFAEGLDGHGFKVFEKEDRWGDLEGGPLNS